MTSTSTRNRNAHSKLPIGKTFHHASQGRLIMLDADLSSSLVELRIRLHVHLPRLLILQDNVSYLGTPVLHVHPGHVAVKGGTGLDVGNRLVDVQLLEVPP